MSRWIRDGEIIDRDFAYLCGNIVAGLWIGYGVGSKGKHWWVTRRLSLTTADNSYGVYVRKIIKKLTGLNPSIGEYRCKTTIRDRVYNNLRTIVQVGIPFREIEMFDELMSFKEDFQKLNLLLLKSNKKMQRRFLQAILDAKASPYLDKKWRDLNMNMPVNKKQFPIVSSTLSAYGIHHGYSPKTNPRSISICSKEDVGKIINEIGFNSKRVKNKIKELTGYLYNL